MSTASALEPDGAATAERGARRLARGVTATWWYTVAAVVVFEVVIVLTTVQAVLQGGSGLPATVIAVGLGGMLWVASTIALLIDYRHRTDATPLIQWRRQLLPVLVTVAYGLTAGAISGLWVVGALPLLQSLMLLNWQSGVRLRVVLAATVVLVGLVAIDAQRTGDAEALRVWGVVSSFSMILPGMTVVSLWWWDVLVRLDRARASESRLAATQERLRVATDVHDLQGHHLQVIALQLELAERLITKDPDAALDQLRAARGSVAEAQQGTRDLALRFRSVPLSDEIANAVDLLRAAGTSAEATVDAGADRAPASVLGPVIRETTTNVLRHGGGKWAHLSLKRAGASWRYEIVNDGAAGQTASDDGSGLEGVARRASEAGGTLEVRRGKQEFAVVVTVPAGVPGEEAR
ncbi:sensor histidine kinase [Microbacterium sp. AK031]|uniref:sensor histidine kinase n=1 Tax=Microbacterium sp. AK031 TaxID=2723076 RepID=UPI002169AD5B|nr:histidine kinase [Microbacterium sp. AK031]MCS3844918.1 two-component system sensor histidine kinase DesK [Microbacterium sp. AK031]